MNDLPPSPAHAYSAYFGPAIFRPLSQHLIELAAPRPGDRVLAVASGTGIVGRAAAYVVGPTEHVVGVDLNPAMVQVARTIPPPVGMSIDWRQGDGTVLDLPSGAFDLVCCQQGLQFFPDRSAGAAEMRRVLADGGRAVVAVWQGLDGHPLYAALAEAEVPHLTSLGVAISRDELAAPFSFGDPEALHDLLVAAGFSQVTIHTRTVHARFPDADCFVHRMEYAYAAVVPRFAADPEAFQTSLDAIGRDTADVVSQYRHGDHVVVPMHSNIAVASA